MRLAWGGTVNMEYPKFSEVAHGLIRELGIDIPRLRKDYELQLAGLAGRPAAGAPVQRGALRPRRAAARRDARRPRAGRARDACRCIPAAGGRTREAQGLPVIGSRRARGQVGARSARHTCTARVTRTSSVSSSTCRMRPSRSSATRRPASGAYRRRNLSVAECLWSGLPGAHVVGGLDDPGQAENDRDTAMFPDGNSSIARLLVRALVPGAFPGMAADADPFSVVTARLDYAALDRPASPVRLRLNATAVHVANGADGAGVAVDYVQAGELLARPREAGRARLLQRRHSPPRAGTAGGAEGRARPVREAADAGRQHVLRNGEAFGSSASRARSSPAASSRTCSWSPASTLATTSPAWRPEEPCVVQSFASFGGPLPASSLADQTRAARAQMLAMPFEDYEREVRSVLTSLLGPGGFDAARDILAITVNRWPHGYARDHLDLEDADWNTEPASRGGRPAALRQHRDRELRRRRGRLHACRDRPGVAGGQRARRAPHESGPGNRMVPGPESIRGVSRPRR